MLFECGGSSLGFVITEVQLMLDSNVEAKRKMHIVYQVMRGDFTTADVDSQTPTMKRKAVAVALAPDMRTLQHEAMRELVSLVSTLAPPPRKPIPSQRNSIPTPTPTPTSS